VTTSTYRDILRIANPLDEAQMLLVDGHSLAYRAFYGIPELTTRAGVPVNAVFGFWRTLVKLLRSYPSAFVSVVFDAPGPTFRHELYPDYKATRKPMPEELHSQFPLLERMLDALGIPVFSIGGVEADDVLASIAVRAAAGGLRCLIATSDKDMAQVVSDRVFLLRPTGRGSSATELLLDRDGVEATFGVPPERIVDLLALVGDSSDNVPGVPGVGQKTATKLLTEHESLDAVLDAAEAVRNRRVSENLKAHRHDAHLARDLIRLKTDVEIDAFPDACRLRGIDATALAGLFTETEFTRALDELGLDPVDAPPDAPATQSGPARPVTYRTVLDRADLDRVIAELGAADFLSIDLETTSLDPVSADIVGIALSTAPYVGDYIPVGHDALGAPDQLPLDEVLEALGPFIEGETTKLIGQNLKYDWTILVRHGLNPGGIAFDTMIASHLAEPEERHHNLERIAATRLGYTMTTFAEVAGKDGPFAAVPVERATEYAAEDAEIVQRLREPLGRALEANDQVRLFEDVELPLIPVLGRMELAGILLDESVLTEQGDEIRRELRIVEADLEEIAGVAFNPNSPKQVGEILFERLGLPVIERTKTGPSTSARVLAELAIQHPLPGKLIVYRELTKLLSTYIDQLPKAINPHTGRIHTSFHQAATATGRLSSSEPNLQNIPTRTEIGGRIRRAFVAPDGWRLVAADYSQIELRLLAHLSEDDLLLDAFRHGLDLHRLTASRVFSVPEERVDDRMRDAAKRINFGILYGISPYGLARELGVSQAEAKAYIDRFFSAYPATRAFLDRLVETATERGYAETILGRRRPLPNLGSRNVPRRNFDRRNAVNTPIQGSAADLIKLAMIAIDREIREHDIAARMLLQIHDELVFEVEESGLEAAVERIERTMVDVMTLRLPLEVKVTVGDNWSEL